MAGAILLTSSVAARKVLDGHAVYAGSKAAVEASTRNWAVELKDRRIRRNVLSPGPSAIARDQQPAALRTEPGDRRAIRWCQPSPVSTANSHN